VDEILRQCKISTYNTQNMEKILHQLHTKKRQPQWAAFSLYLSGRN
jgi:hypothetical protein